MQKSARTGGLVLAAVSCLLLSNLSPALADEAKDAEELLASYQRGKALFAQGKYAEATPEWERVLTLAERNLGPDHASTAIFRLNVAVLYREQRLYAKVEPMMQRSLTTLETKLGKDDPSVANALAQLGRLYYEQALFTKAEPLFERSLRILEAREGKDSVPVATALNNLAEVYREQGHYDRAEPLYQRALAISEARLGKDHPEVATLLTNLGLLYRGQKRYQEALPVWQRSLQIREDKLGKCLNSLAGLYQRQGSYAQAEALYRRSLHITETAFGADNEAVATLLNNLATVYDAQGCYPEAEQLLLRSIQIDEGRRGKDDPHAATSLNNLAGLYRTWGLTDQATTLLERSLQIYETKLGKDHPLVATALTNLAGAYQAQRRYKEAEAHYQRSLRITEDRLGKDHPTVATTLTNLAGLYIEQRRFPEAQPLLERSLRIRETALGKGHPRVANTLHTLAGLYQRQGKYAEAAPLLERSLQVTTDSVGKDHPDVLHSQGGLAELYMAQEHWDKAATTLDLSWRLQRRQAAQILPALSESDQLAFLHQNFEPLWHLSLTLALLQRDTAAMPALSATWVLNAKGLAQQVLTERTLLARDSQDPELKEIVRQLIAVRARLATQTFASIPAGQEADHRKELAQLSEEERKLSRQLRQRAGRPVRDDPWIELDEVRRTLPADAVLIDLAWVHPFDSKTMKWQPPHYAAWIIPPADKGSVRLIDLGEAVKLEAVLTAACRELQEGSRRAAQIGEVKTEREAAQALQELAQRVLAPLLEHIDPAEQWIISPDALLWLLPWEALPLPDGRYALEKHRIRYVLSSRDLVLVPSAHDSTAPLVLADPDFDLGLDEAQAETRKLLDKEETLRGTGRLSGALADVPFPRLPGTADEALAIAAPLERYARQTPRIGTGRQALEGVFKVVKQPRVVVLSSHGFLLADQEEALEPRSSRLGERGVELIPLEPSSQPRNKSGRPRENPLLRCGLALAGANHRAQAAEATDDGILTRLEIVGTDLRGCELVVLSACETGLGEIRNGEGVAGLRQAFQLAGARSVVATLWKIPDQETAQLMSAFFENLAAGQGKAEALRQAQLALIKERRASRGAAHPFYWAAFTLTGQGE